MLAERYARREREIVRSKTMLTCTGREEARREILAVLDPDMLAEEVSILMPKLKQNCKDSQRTDPCDQQWRSCTTDTPTPGFTRFCNGYKSILIDIPMSKSSLDAGRYRGPDIGAGCPQGAKLPWAS